MTPYHGEGEIIVPSQPVGTDGVQSSTCYVSFTNTPSEQRLEVRFSRVSTGDESRFTVLFRDDRTVTVVGHAVTFIPGMQSNANESGSYGILSRVGNAEVLIAIFPVSEVLGVFSGELGQLGA